MRKILILMGRYLPGHRDGGPLRTIVNLTDALGDEYEFYIACLDRDHGDIEPYLNISYNSWNIVGKAMIWYVKPGGFTFTLLRDLASEVDLIYTCSFYDDYGYKTLLLNKFGKLYGKPVVVASMGVFSEGALAQKSVKKKLFIRSCRRLGLFHNIKWSVTSEMEMKDVKREVGDKAECMIAEDIPRPNVPGRRSERRGYSEWLDIVFLSRISPQKNLMGAIECLKNLRVNAQFTIYGPKEDVEYWDRCLKELKKLPPNICWSYEGDVLSEEVQQKLREHDIFLFPTKGENYGHVIFEALSVGCIPIISDQTPWNVIAERKAGYVLPLTEDMREFTYVLENIIKKTEKAKIEMSERAVKIAEEKAEQARKNTGYRMIFG